uniref:Uncharacterized protein n=1 Tax=Rhizophora mucronata TaxID=61149 RepID=A0A2P2MYL4_RHIMU
MHLCICVLFFKLYEQIPGKYVNWEADIKIHTCIHLCMYNSYV